MDIRSGSSGIQEYTDSIINERTKDSTIVFSVIFSPPLAKGSRVPPTHLICSSSSGKISFFRLADILGKNNKKNCPAIELKVHEGPVYTLCFVEQSGEQVLLSGGDDGRVCGFRWSLLLKALSKAQPGDTLDITPGFQLVCPQTPLGFGGLSPVPEVNSIAALSTGEVVCGSGDGVVRVWDCNSGRVLNTLTGHSDLVHCVVARPTQSQVLSGSEDGTMRVWDLRASGGGACTTALDVWNAKVLSKDEYFGYGRPWVGCLAVDPSDHWVAAGCGARSIALYSLTAGQVTAHIPTSAPPQALVLDNNRLSSVGAEPFFTQWNIQGKLIKQTDCTPSSAFGLAVHPCGLTVVGGSSGGAVDVISEIGSTIAVLHCT